MAAQLAHPTAKTAGAFADSLAGDLMAVAQVLRSGQLRDALDHLEMSADRLQRFLTFLVTTSELLAETNPRLGTQLGEYNGRLLAVLGRVEESLDQQDLATLTLTLEHGLSLALEDYASVDTYVQQALERAVAA